MKNDIDIKSLWKGQQVPAIDLSAVRKKIKYFRLRRMGESCAVIMLMMLASASGVTVWIHWPPLAVCYQGWNYSTIHGLHAAGPILRQTASSLLWIKNRLLQRRLYEQSSENQETGT